jgi:hypothetical protein
VSALQSQRLQPAPRAEAVGSLLHSNHRGVRRRDGARHTGCLGKTVQLSKGPYLRPPFISFLVLKDEFNLQPSHRSGQTAG